MSEYDYILTRRTVLNHNTFEIELRPVLEFKKFDVSSFFYIYHQETKRPYTPIFAKNNKIILAIKKYPNGILSNYLFDAEINSVIKASEPITKREYKKEFRDVLMIAGGTGITPMLQILDFDKQTNFLVLFCNLSANDIFLEDLLTQHENARVVHILQHNNQDKTIEETKKDIRYGMITKEIISELAILDNELLYDFTFVCGPPSFLEAVCGSKAVDKTQGELKGMLKDLNFDKKKVFKF